MPSANSTKNFTSIFTGDSPRLKALFARMETSRLIRGRSDVCVRNLLFALAINCKPQAILEIGSHIGAAALVLGQACRLNRTGRVYALEPNKIFYAQLRKNIQAARLEKFIVPIRGASDAPRVRARLRRRQFQLIFIDAQHDYRAVQAELRHYSRLLADNACIVLHDSSIEAMALDKEKRGGVRAVIMEFCRKRPEFKPIFFEPPLWGNPQGACLLCKQGNLRLPRPRKTRAKR